MTLVDQRDPHKLFHPANVRKLQSLTPTFDWKSYLAGVGLVGNDRFNVSQPRFFQTLDFQLRMRSLAEIKTYLRWHVAHVSAPFLSKPFVDENFDYYRKTLRGVTQVAPLWQRCVVLVDAQIGEALGQEFVKLTFGPELKAKTLHMTASGRSRPRWKKRDQETLELDGSADQGQGAGEAARHRQQDRLPRAVARLLGARDQGRRPARQRPARRRVRGAPPARCKIGKPVDHAASGA